MEAGRYSETLVIFYQVLRPNITEDSVVQYNAS
jgi:hypothetical protein